MRSAVLEMVSMTQSMFWDVMSEYMVSETAAFYSVPSITRVTESSVNTYMYMAQSRLVGQCL